MRARGFTVLLTIIGLLALPIQHAAAFPVTVKVNATQAIGALPPIWRFFGADEPNYSTRPQGEKLLLELGKLHRGEVYFRAHNLMTT